MDQADNDGTTPLIMAAQQGHLEVVRALLVGGADKGKVITGPDGRRCTALSVARMQGHHDIANLLAGRTLLHIAALNGEVEALRELLEATADLEAADESGLTALDLAMSEGNAECVALLERPMLAVWESATESSLAMERYLRWVAKEGDAAKVAALLERCKAVNVEAADKVCWWSG